MDFKHSSISLQTKTLLLTSLMSVGISWRRLRDRSGGKQDRFMYGWWTKTGEIQRWGEISWCKVDVFLLHTSRHLSLGIEMLIFRKQCSIGYIGGWSHGNDRSVIFFFSRLFDSARWFLDWCKRKTNNCVTVNILLIYPQNTRKARAADFSLFCRICPCHRYK